MQFAEGRLTPSYGTSLDDTGNDSTYGITVCLDLTNESGHLFCHTSIGAANVVAVYEREVVVGICPWKEDIAHLLGICLNGDTLLMKQHTSKGSSHYSAYGLAC